MLESSCLVFVALFETLLCQPSCQNIRRQRKVIEESKAYWGILEGRGWMTFNCHAQTYSSGFRIGPAAPPPEVLILSFVLLDRSLYCFNVSVLHSHTHPQDSTCRSWIHILDSRNYIAFASHLHKVAGTLQTRTEIHPHPRYASYMCI